MKSGYSPDEFRQLMEPWAPEERALVEERATTGFSSDRLKNLTEQEAAVLRAVLARLVPVGEGIDLVGFFERTANDALGRGDRKPGGPDAFELIRQGLAAVQNEGFTGLDPDGQDALLRRAQADEIGPEGWFKRLLTRAMHGAFAHPALWRRIGFPGAAYPEGYVWLGGAETRARHERKLGWNRL